MDHKKTMNIWPLIIYSWTQKSKQGFVSRWFPSLPYEWSLETSHDAFLESKRRKDNKTRNVSDSV